MFRKRAFLIFLSLMLALLFTAGATETRVQDEPKTVRVGWYESAFHRTDSFGRRSGYGYEYQQRIATYTGWHYEYVEGSWSELFEKLVQGEIDLLSDVSYTEARAEKILYSSEAMGGEDYHVFIAPSNTEITPDDFDSFNGKKVGVNKNSIQELLFADWAKSHNVTPEITELTGKTPELIEMLLAGDIDALVTLDTYGNSGEIVPVCKVGSANSYFGINKNRPDIKRELDVAMNRIFQDNRDFNQQMTERYHKSGAVNSFLTADEKEWLAGHGVIRIGYRDAFKPYCDRDEKSGLLIGALADYLSFAEKKKKNAKLNFETYPFTTTQEALNALKKGEIDCIFPINFSAYDGEQLGIIITDPLVVTEMFAAVRTADRVGISSDQEMTVAVLNGHPNHETFLKDNFPSWRLRYYDTKEDCFRAVGNGEADCTLVSNYRINRVSELCAANKLSTLATGENMGLSFAMNQKDDCLYSILNKINRLIPNSTLNASLTQNSFLDEKVTFVDFLRDNLIYFVVAVATVAIAILLLILWNMKSAARAREGSAIISETERDPLTQLYNRNYFNVYANRLYRDNPLKPMDAIVMNIERFHSLNTLNGRAFGDEVLRTLGDEIRAFLAETEGIAARTDGDHFDIYCAHQENYPGLLRRFQTRMKALSQKADIRLRMGVKPWQEDLTPQQMFDMAWSACRIIRGHYKTHLMVYDEELRKRDSFNQRLQNDLTGALERGDLEVYYQPKYNIQCDPPKLDSAEALVRWNHPEYGLISPADFIPIFERSGQISALDQYVWTKAAAQIASWRDRLGIALPVSVNLSRVDVFDSNLMTVLDELIRRNGLKSSELQLEITESAYTENADQLIRVINQLREKGYEIEMDDFGSGFSSLNMLSSMPIDVLKMDIAFIQNIERNERDFRLVELIIDIARYLKVPVVAEGVETKNQLRLLKDAGCDVVQGYYFSRPLPVNEFEKKILKA